MIRRAKESPDEKPPADPELQPDKNGLLPHSRLGGNTTSPLIVGGFASCHKAGVNFAFGEARSDLLQTTPPPA